MSKEVAFCVLVLPRAGGGCMVCGEEVGEKEGEVTSVSVEVCGCD